MRHLEPPSKASALQTAAILLVVFLFTRFGDFFSLPPSNISAFWPANAVLLAGVFLVSTSIARITLLLALPTYFLAEVWIGYPSVNAAAYSFANVAEVAVFLWLLHKKSVRTLTFDSITELFVFLAFAVLASLVGGSIGGFAAILAGGDFHTTVLRWSLADFFGYCLFAPLVLCWGTWRRFFSLKNPGRIAELVTLYVALLLFAALSSGAFGLAMSFGAQFLPVPILLWAALRFGPPGGAFATTVVACFAFFSATHGVGLFSIGSPVENVQSLQLFFVSLVVSVMTIASLNAERKKSYNALRQEVAVHKQTEQDLLLVRFALDNVPEAAFLIDENACLRFVNEGACNSLGYTRDELLNMRVADVDPDFPMSRWQEHWRQLKTERSLLFEGRHRTKEGRIFPVEISANYFQYNGRDFNLGLARDITERKQAEEKLLQSEQRLRLHAEQSPLGFLEWDENFRAIEWNAACEKIFGYSREEAIGRHAKDLILPVEVHELVDGIYRSLMNQTGGQHSINENTTKSGQIIICEWFNTTLINKDGKAIGVASICRDITEIKQAEKERQLHTEFLATIDRISRAIQRASDLDAMMASVLDEVLDIFECDRAYLLYPCDPSAKTWTIPMERTRPEYPGAGVLNEEQPMDAEMATTLKLLLSAPGALKFDPESEHIKPKMISARYGIKSSMVVAIYPKVGDVWQFGVHQCSYERAWTSVEVHLLEEIGRRLADSLTSLLVTRNMRASERRLVEAQHLVHLGNWQLDLINNVLTWSDEIYRIFEIDKKSFGGCYEAFLDAIHPDDREMVNSTYNESVIERRPYNIVHRLLMSDGRIKYVNERCETVYDAAGKPLRSVGTVQDITEQKLREDELHRYRDHLEDEVRQRTDELRLARDAAETANKAKSAFLANMSHELRTPLNAILGFSQMMRQDTGLTGAQHETLEIINNSGEHLLRLVNNVLEIAKIEAGKMQLEIAPLDLQGVVREVSDMMRLRAQQKGLLLEIDQSSSFPRYVKGDEARLRQILVNLLSNAVKFTEQGGVTLRLWVEHYKHHLVIEVKDTGPGIAADDQKLLFSPFVQLHSETAESGTGLGLSIVHQFVQLMGGNVEVESERGKGSLFRVRLPLETVDEAGVTGLADNVHGKVTGMEPGQPTYRILVAEDHRDNQLLLARLMADLGMEVKIAANGKECIELFQEWRPHLIWMDRRMPILDGVKTTRRIRQLPGGDKVKIVAVTASVFKEQQDELLAAGVDDTIRKPFRFNEIYNGLERHLGVKFIYSDKEVLDVKIPTTPLTPQRLAVVEPELRLELQAAVESLDSTRIDAVIDCIGKIDGGLAGTLHRMVNEFDYPSILGVLKKEEVNS